MAEIKIYKKCRNLSKIKKDIKYKGKSKDCILYFSFHKKLKSGSKVKDLSGNKNNGKIIGVTKKIKKKKN
jgi:hypothetical protein